MALPVSPNPISIDMIRKELGIDNETNVSLNDPRLRHLAGKNIDGARIQMSDFHGKSSIQKTSFTIQVGSATWAGVKEFGYSEPDNFGRVIHAPGSIREHQVVLFKWRTRYGWWDDGNGGGDLAKAREGYNGDTSAVPPTPNDGDGMLIRPASDKILQEVWQYTMNMYYQGPLANFPIYPKWVIELEGKKFDLGANTVGSNTSTGTKWFNLRLTKSQVQDINFILSKREGANVEFVVYPLDA